MAMLRPLLLAVVCLASSARAVRADDHIPGHVIDRGTTGVVIAGALTAALGASLIPIGDGGGRWASELFGELDLGVRGAYSPRAMHVSDALVGAALIAPVGYLVGGSIDDADGDRLLVYGEALAIDLALFQLAKRLVHRPRPYVYGDTAETARATAEAGEDSYQSFYSAHAASAFCAATAGAYLASASTDRAGLRTLAWGAGAALAAATAHLRVRAGKHFYSDVIIGAAIGAAIGYAVPALHADAGAYVPSTADLAAVAGGIVVGAVASELVPLEARPGAVARLRLGPLPVAGGAGLALVGRL